MSTALTLNQLNRRIAAALSQPVLQNVWVVAELSDLRVSNGHCYMELIEKHPDTGAVLARMRAVIWANLFPRLNADFFGATGQRLASGLKVMVCGSVTFHAAFGMSFVISQINASFTMGEVERRRREILQRLQREGVLDLNRQIEWPTVASRIAVISAPGAAGYGDFINQLYHNDRHLRFTTHLFPAVMQGDRTSPSVIAALDAIAADLDAWDCVVIIRGGGATSDLVAFDDYPLAANIAQFSLPVIIGIGHERDITVLDYVANMRVKTPTAAAEWLIARGEALLDSLHRTAADIIMAARGKTSDATRQLAYLESTLCTAPRTAMQRAGARLQQATVTLAGAGARRIAPELSRIDHTFRAIATAARTCLGRRGDYLDSRTALLDALSPAATLARGYSITTGPDGHALRSAASLHPGDIVTTTLANGKLTSTIKEIN